MSIRETNFYVEQFKIEEAVNGFRSARTKLLEAFLVETRSTIEIFAPVGDEQPEDMMVKAF